jgi:hypothetical protein
LLQRFLSFLFFFFWPPFSIICLVALTLGSEQFQNRKPSSLHHQGRFEFKSFSEISKKVLLSNFSFPAINFFFPFPQTKVH